jgi:cytoskeletal protein RodZ
MEGNTQSKVRARDAAMRLLSRLTTGIALAAVAGVGMLTAVSAYTIPGTTPTTATTSATSSSSSSSSSASSTVPSSSTPVVASSNPPVAVTGGSR